MRLPDLTDPELRQAAAKALPAIEAHAAELDAVSSDLKKIESYLQQSDVRLEVSVPVRDAGGESIGWLKGEGTWRIRYLGGPNSGIFRPLLEMPAAVRIRAQKALPALVLAIAEAVQCV